ATRVHVIAGGGRGAAAIVQLAAAGYTLSVGVLGAGDTDLHAARLAGARTVTRPAFAPIDSETDRAHRLLVAAADVVVVAAVPWGRSNLPNLEAVMEASRVVLLEGEPAAARDFTGGAATALLNQLAARCPVATLDRLCETIDSFVPTTSP
ncbi:MAG: vitamin B12 ABC transporter ATP-binding protein BtuD, partial [Dehalococcoidia bacterium]|nr:vitamin B12 ABC transporter ATP-binding protein BtuD [Dehalococcoidia bacterium]